MTCAGNRKRAFSIRAVSLATRNAALRSTREAAPGWRRGMPIKWDRPAKLTFRYPFDADNLTRKERFVATVR
jgi:hypothetical protein